MSDDGSSNVIPFQRSDSDPSEYDETIPMLEAEDGLMLRNAVTDAFADVDVVAYYRPYTQGLVVRAGDYELTAGEARWLAARLVEAADVLDPHREEHVHTRKQIEAERERLGWTVPPQL